MKGWIKFGSHDEALPTRPLEHSGWHKGVEIWVVTACGAEVKTDERPGAKEPGYGAKVCPGCLATRDE
jgi:hypothetical protein